MRSLEDQVAELQAELAAKADEMAIYGEELAFYDGAVAAVAGMSGYRRGEDPLASPEDVLAAIREACTAESVAILRRASGEFRVITSLPQTGPLVEGQRVESTWLYRLCSDENGGRRRGARACENTADSAPELAELGVERLMANPYTYLGEVRVLALCNRWFPASTAGGRTTQWYLTPEARFLEIVVSLFPL